MKTQIIKIVVFTAIFLMILPVNNLSAQGRLQKAREYKANYEFAKAIELYMDIFGDKTPKNDRDIRDIANCYIMMNDLESAQKWLSKINGMTVYNISDIFNYANALRSMGRYDEAIIQYNRMADLFPNRKALAEMYIIKSNMAKDWMENPLAYKVENVEALNSENSEFGLINYKDGFMYSSDRRVENEQYASNEIFGWTGHPYLKLYGLSYLNKTDASTDFMALNDINTDQHNGPGIFDDNSNILYYTVTKLKKEKVRLDANSDPTDFSVAPDEERYVNRLEIYSAMFDGDKWTNVKAFQFNNSDEYSVGHPALSPDGNTLYFSSDMPGGYGQSDIFYSEKLPDGTWSEPKNAGPEINSIGKEGFPFVDPNGVLYFSSDGLPGMGGLDIFKAYGEKSEWSEPENLKYPLNSPKDDFSVFLDEDHSGYFSSNRDGGKGGDDIYYFHKQLVIVVNAKELTKDNTLVPLSDVNLEIINNEKGLTENSLTNELGSYLKQTPCGTTYDINASKEGYFVQSKKVEAGCSLDTLVVDLIFDKIEKDKAYVLENIYYDYNKWNIRSDAAEELDKLVEILEENPQIDIELSSHTDARGTFKYNENLSQNRAESAVEYIISKGISPDRLVAKGYGEYKLRNKCADGVKCSEADHQLNRRTEFKVINIREE